MPLFAEIKVIISDTRILIRGLVILLHKELIYSIINEAIFVVAKFQILILIVLIAIISLFVVKEYWPNQVVNSVPDNNIWEQALTGLIVAIVFLLLSENMFA